MNIHQTSIIKIYIGFYHAYSILIVILKYIYTVYNSLTYKYI